MKARSPNEAQRNPESVPHSALLHTATAMPAYRAGDHELMSTVFVGEARRMRARTSASGPEADQPLIRSTACPRL